MSPRGLATLVALGLALPAAAYLPPATALLKRAAQQRVETRLPGVEAHGTLLFQGEAAAQAAAALGESTAITEVSVPAVLTVKGPGRCRLELTPGRPGSGAAEAPAAANGAAAAAMRDAPTAKGAGKSARPVPPRGGGAFAYSVRGGKAGAQRGLETLPAARALVEGLCVLAADGPGSPGEVERALAGRLASHGVALGTVSLGRVEGRVGWVLGAPSPRAEAATSAPVAGPQAWLDKNTFQPVRLLATLAGAPRDVRLLEVPTEGEANGFPRTVEVWAGAQLEARFHAERVAPAPRLPDSAF